MQTGDLKALDSMDLERAIEVVREIGLRPFLAQVELAVIDQVMAMNHNNCSQASKMLKMGRTALVETRRRYKLPMGSPPSKGAVKNEELPADVTN